MEKNIYSKEGVVDTIVKDDYIIVTWQVLHDKEALYDSCKAQLDLVKKGGISYIIIDIAEAKGTPPQEVQNWFVEELFPGYGEVSNFKGLVNILPKNTISKMGSARWKKSAESGNFGFEVFETESLNDALKIIQTP